MSAMAAAAVTAAGAAPAGAAASGRAAASSAASSAITISGRVTDGTSGHADWPVYAKVTLAGTTAQAYTNPATGQYQLQVPAAGTYTVQASPVTPGYQQASARVTTGAHGATWNVADPVNQVACSAPGYHGDLSVSEDFSATSTPPGWTVATKGDQSNTWQFNAPGGWQNSTGGTGNYAVAYENDAYNPVSTVFTSPVINLSGSAEPVLRFDQAADFTSPFAVQAADVSINGGTTWTTAWHSTGSDDGTPVQVALPEAAGKPSVRVRFTLSDNGEGGNGDVDFWQVDDVTVTSCAAEPGGLLVGRVTDANTGLAVNGASVAGPSGPSAVTVATPGDPAVDGGLYWLFTGHTGSRQFSASAAGYATQASAVTVPAGQVAPASFQLGAGRLALSSAAVTGTTTVGATATATVTVRNTGTAPAAVTITPTWPSGTSQSGTGQAGTAQSGSSQSGTRPAAAAGTQAAPQQRVSIGAKFVPRISALISGAHLGTATAGTGSAPAGGALAAAVPGDTPWLTSASLPVATAAAAAAADPATGAVYAAGGATSAVQATAAAYLLDPATGKWQALPPMSHARGGAQAAFAGGEFIVTGGWDDSSAEPVPATEIYDPARSQWSPGASIPRAYYGAATAVLDGKMYVVGGCDVVLGECDSDSVQVYNPASNEWSLAAPYPAQTAFASCGAISGQLYCAGGYNDVAGSTAAGYAYDPRANTWTPIPDMPVDLFGGVSAAADGQLLVSGGWTADGSVLTNQGYAFSPATQAWSPLPDAPGQPVFDSVAACGLYRVGGAVIAADEGDSAPTAAVDELAGFGGCGGQPWLTTAPSSVTVAPGQTATISVRMNAAQVSQPGTYTAALRFASDTPYPAPVAQARLTAGPPASWGEVTGTVTGRSCTGITDLAGATVQIGGRHGYWFPVTAGSGRYSLWLNNSNSPLTLIVSKPGWQPQYARIAVSPGKTAARNFELALVSGCG
jgi:N-acetylneuraminic acid mutarotase